MEKKLVSIIIPVYNVEPYLRRCVDSVLRQTYKNIEIIIVNDGSTDGCAEICDEYGKNHANITVIHKPNGGLSSARNAGLDIAKGQYISFVDSDDYILEEIIEHAVELLEKENAQLLAFKVGYSRDGVSYPDYSTISERYRVLENDELMYRFVTEKRIGIGDIACNKLFEAELWKNLRFREGILFEDLDIMYSVFQKVSRCVYLDEFGYVQYIRENSITQSVFNLKKMCIIDVYDRLRMQVEAQYGAEHVYYGFMNIRLARSCKKRYKEILQQDESGYQSEQKRLRDNMKESLQKAKAHKKQYWIEYYQLYWFYKKVMRKYETKTCN